MTNAITEFTLAGHDCPLGAYPSIVVPVGRVGRSLVVAYLISDHTVRLEDVDPDSRYEEHVGATIRALADFDYRKHGLFAFSKEDVRLFTLDREKAFFKDLLLSPRAIEIDVFYRLSLSLMTGEKDLVEKAFRQCENAVRSELPEEVVRNWIDSNRFILDGPLTEPQLDALPSEHKVVAPLTDDQGLGRFHYLSESDVNRLLHQVYKFKRNQHNRNTNRSFISWDWVYQNRILVRSVTRWRPGHFHTEAESIAASLGLQMKELEQALEGRYSRESLLLNLFIHQIHRYLERFDSQDRAVILENAKSFLAGIDSRTISKDRDLFRLRRSALDKIEKFHETEQIGQELSTLML